MWSLDGVGLFGIEVKAPPKEGLIVTTTRSHGNKAINSALEALKPTEILRVGGAGHKVLLVVEGKAHAYVFPSSGTKKWDSCAPEAILNGAGGKLTDIFAKDILYHKEIDYVNRTGILAATSPEMHAKVAKLIPEDVKASLLSSSL